MWAHMAHSRRLRRILLRDYDRIGVYLPFDLVK